MAQRCTKTFAGFHTSGRRVISVGQLLADDDPFVGAFPANFEPVDDFVERMTARPGERRGLSRASQEARAQAQQEAEERSVRVSDYSCDQCEYSTGTERGLAVHKSRAHKEE